MNLKLKTFNALLYIRIWPYSTHRISRWLPVYLFGNSFIQTFASMCDDGITYRKTSYIYVHIQYTFVSVAFRSFGFILFIFFRHVDCIEMTSVRCCDAYIHRRFVYLWLVFNSVVMIYSRTVQLAPPAGALIGWGPINGVCIDTHMITRLNTVHFNGPNCLLGPPSMYHCASLFEFPSNPKHKKPL